MRWAVAVRLGLVLTAALLIPTRARAQSIQLQPDPRVAFDSTTVRVSRDPANLVGTLLRPREVNRPPVVLFVGAAPVDRDGNVPGAPGRTDAIRQLAESLAVRGIASLRYDPRGIGASTRAALPEHQMRLEVFARDVSAWLVDLERRALGPVVVVGYDDGGFVALKSRELFPDLTSPRELVPAAVVLLGLSARPADVRLREQVVPGQPPEQVARIDALLAALRADSIVDVVPISLAHVFRPTMQPYLASWMRTTPAGELARVTVPCLLVRGAHDLQVTGADVDTLAKAQPECLRATIDSMTHALKRGAADPAAQAPAWLDPREPLAPGLLRTLVDFIDLATTRAPASCGGDTIPPRGAAVVGRARNAPTPRSPAVFDQGYLGPFGQATISAARTDSIGAVSLLTGPEARRYGPTGAKCGVLQLRSREALAADSAEAIGAVWQAEQGAHAPVQPTVFTLFDTTATRIVSTALHRALVQRGVAIAEHPAVGEDTTVIALRSLVESTANGVRELRIEAQVRWSERSTNGAVPCRVRHLARVTYRVRRFAGAYQAIRVNPELDGDGVCVPLPPF